MAHDVDRREEARQGFQQVGGALEQDGVPIAQIVEAIGAEFARLAILVLGAEQAASYIHHVASLIPAIVTDLDEVEIDEEGDDELQ